MVQLNLKKDAVVVEIKEAFTITRTPAAQWRVDGEPDPFDGRFDGDLSVCCMGDKDDLTIARELRDCWGKMLSIGALTAAKERIRWLSRRIFLSDDQAWIEQMEIERAQLPMGNLSDDVMANAVFMNGDDRNWSEAIEWLKAGQERIEWLSISLTNKGLNHGQR